MGRKSVKMLAVMAVLAASSMAFAGPVLILDLQVDTGSSASSNTPSNVRTVTNATVGQVVTLDIWGTVSDNASYSGTTGAPQAGDGVTSAVWRMVSNEAASALTGNYQLGARNSSKFTLGGNDGVTHAAYDGVGGSDWGGAYPSTSNTSYFSVGNATVVPFATGTTILLGTIQYSITAAPNNSSTTLLAVPYISSSTGKSGYSFKIGGVTNNNSTDPASLNLNAVDTNQHITSGAGVVISAATSGVPEPASLGVLALGGMALLARRRKSA